MRTFTYLMRIVMTVSLLSLSAYAVTLESDDFSSTLASENWSGTGVSVVSGKMKITDQATASKIFTHSTHANQNIKFTLTTDSSGYETTGTIDTYIITLNGVAYTYNKNNDGTIAIYGQLDGNGELNVTIKSNSDSSSEYVAVDNVLLETTSGVYREFTLRKQLYTQGDMKTIGNTILVNPTGSKTVDHCSAYTNGTFEDGDGATSNSGYYLCGYSVDGTQTNATTAELALPSGAKVIWAGLYWQSIQANAAFSTDMEIKFRKNGDDYQDIKPKQLDYMVDSGAAGYTSYSAFADVTSYFGEGKWNEGNYTVANIPVYEGKIASLGSYGAWSLVTVYQVSDAVFRSVSVFDGWKVVETPTAGTLVSVPVPISGFYTPSKANINATVSIFAAEGDAYFGTSDSRKDVLSTTNYNTNLPVDLGTAYNTFHSSVTGGGYRLPNMSNNMGIDIQTFDIGAYLKPRQDSMEFQFKTAQDTYWPSVLAFSTEIYTPKFCYDYGYEQNGISFTEQNNGTALPRITGTLATSDDINVSIYIRNTETSDVAANNTYLNINSINTAQAVYKRDSVAVTFPKQYTPTSKTDTAWPLAVSDSYIHNIPIGDVNSAEYFYTHYTLKPNSSGDINMSIDGTFGYDLTITKADGSLLIIPYGSTLGGTSLSMCSADNFNYSPVWGIFSMVNAGLYDDTTTNRYYDLPTQVVKRPGNLRIASFKPAPNLDEPQKVSTMVAVEMIDASQFHDVDAACAEPSSATTPRVWIGFENNVSQVNFNAAAIQYAIDHGQVSDVLSGSSTTLASPEDFYKVATSNAAFRVTFNTLNDADGSLIDIKGTVDGSLRIDNFANIHQLYPHCRKPVKNPNNFGMTDLTSVACSDNGNNSTWRDMATCMECLYGADTKVLCSRDNFAIRPESYNVSLKDLNQANHALTQVLASGHTGVTAPVTSQVNMDAGYVYGYEINATSHLDNTNTTGYTRYFGTADNEYNISLSWNPSTVKTGCNDTNSYSQAFNLINGVVSAEGLHSQVGEYKLNIIDKTWTAVDWDSALQGHQTGTHFLSGGECLQNSNVVPATGSVVGLSGTNLTNLVGCNIESTHDNLDNGLKYRDYNLSFKPDHFDLTGVQFATGQRFDVSAINQNVWTYMNNIASDENMSVRYSGNIIASSRLGNSLSNFVSNCYAEPTNLDLNLTFPITAGLPNWRYRLQEVNASTNQIWNDTNAVIVTPDTNTSFPLITIPQTSFLKNQNGFVDLNLSLNFDRNQTLPVNPITVGLQNLQVKCQTSANCSSNAEMIANHLPDTNLTTNSNVTFAYGRLLTKDVRIFGQNSFAANGWYEVFNLPTFNTVSYQPSKNDVNWFINSGHDDISHGDANVTRLISVGAATTVNYGGNDAMGVETFSFPAIVPTYNGKAHVDTAPWLWYAPNALTYSDPSDLNLDCLTHPCFNVTVMPAIGATGSAKSTNTDTKASKASTRGTGWHSTTDYAPAIR